MNSRCHFRMALLPVVLVCLPLPVSFAMHRSKFPAADATSPSVRPTAEGGKTQTFRVMTYNVENLFDTLHDAGFSDEEFLPGSNRDGTVRAIGANSKNWLAPLPLQEAPSPLTSWHCVKLKTTQWSTTCAAEQSCADWTTPIS